MTKGNMKVEILIQGERTRDSKFRIAGAVLRLS